MKSISTTSNKFRDRVLVNRYNPTYFVSSNKGNDSNDGLTEQTPWETLAKVETESSGFTAGDVIAFRGGDKFYDTLSFTGLTGGVGSPITFTSYGTGKAIITGGESITGWTKEGANYVKTMGSVYQTFKDNTVMKMARYPKIIDDYSFTVVCNDGVTTVAKFYHLPTISGESIQIRDFEILDLGVL